MAFIALGAIAGALLSAQSESEKQTPIQQGRLAQPTGGQYQPTVSAQTNQKDPTRIQKKMKPPEDTESPDFTTSEPAASSTAVLAKGVEGGTKAAAGGAAAGAGGAGASAANAAGASQTLGNVAAAAQLGGKVGEQLFKQPNLTLQGQLAQPSNYQYQPTVDPRRRIGSYY